MLKISPVVAISVVALVACFMLVPVIAVMLGGWYAYWGALLLSVVWALILLWLKLTKFWREGE